MKRFDVGTRCLRTRNGEHSLLGDLAHHSRQHTRSRDSDFFPSTLLCGVVDAGMPIVHLRPNRGNTTQAPNLVFITR